MTENGIGETQPSLQTLDIYKQYLKNTNMAEPYEAEILWGLRRNESLEVLFPKLIDLITRLFNDPLFGDECMKILENT